MNEDIHNEDEHFKRAYERMEEDPSPEVWEKINAGLNDRDAVYYRSRFVTWKRIACLLLLLLSVTVLYQIFSHEEQKTVSTRAQSDTASDIHKSVPLDEQSSTDDAAHQRVNKSHDTANALQNDKSDNEMAGDVHTSDHRKQSLPAEGINENKNESSPVQTETSVAQSNPKRIVIKPERSLLPSQEQQAHHLYDSVFNKEIQTTESVHSNLDSQSGESVTANRNYQNDQSKIQKDSVGAVTLSIDSLQSKTSNQSASSKGTIRIHNSRKSSWTITPFMSADFTGYELDDDDHQRGGGQPEPHRQEIEGRETHQFSFSAGAFARWQFSPKLSLRTGLVYSNIAIGIQPQTLYATRDNNQSIGYKYITSSGYAYVKPVFSSPVTGDSITADIAHHHLQFLSVPLMLGYRFSVKKRLSVTPSMGLMANMLLSTRIKTELFEDTDKEMVVISRLQGIRKTYFSFVADAEVNCFINKRISLSLLPMFRYAINPITKDNVVNTFPYSLGIGVGATYSF